MVLGHKTLDCGLSSLGQAFPIVASNKCVLLKCNRQYFDKKIWKRTLDTQMEVKMRQYLNFSIFQELSDQTMYTIMYEAGHVLLFKPG